MISPVAGSRDGVGAAAVDGGAARPRHQPTSVATDTEYGNDESNHASRGASWRALRQQRLSSAVPTLLSEIMRDADHASSVDGSKNVQQDVDEDDDCVDLTSFECPPAATKEERAIDVMAIIQRYPALAAIWHHFVGCTFVESDGFVEKSRKLAVAFLFCGIVIVAVLPYYIYRAASFTSQCSSAAARFSVSGNGTLANADSSDNTALACARAANMWFIVALYVVYASINAFTFAYVRWHRRCPDALIATTWVTIIICTGAVQISLPAFPVEAALIAVAFGLVITQPPGQSAILVVELAALGVKVTNDVFNNVASLPGSYDLSVRTWPDALFVRLAGVVLLAVSFTACIVLVNETHSRQLQAARAAELALSVANRLMRYDTDGCRDVITGYRARTGAADEPLIAAMTGLVANLERYRPFLPNYLLDTDSASDQNSASGKENDDAEKNDGTEEERPRSQPLEADGMQPMPPISGATQSPDHHGGEESHAATLSHAATAPVHAQVSSPSYDGQTAVAMTESRLLSPWVSSRGNPLDGSSSKRQKSLDATRGVSSPPLRGPDFGMNSVSTISASGDELRASGTSGPVLFVDVAAQQGVVRTEADVFGPRRAASPIRGSREPPPRAAAPSMGPALEGWSRTAVCFGRLVVQPLAFAETSVASSAAQHRFVNDLHAISQTTGAALHAFVGDTLIVTWNATRRVAQAETRACRFMLGVRDWIARDRVHAQHFACWGAVTSANAKCLFAGGDRLRLFYCAQQGDTGETEAKASAMLSTARALHSVVVDRRTWDGARFQIAAIPVDLVATLQPTSGVAPEPIFEILKDESGDMAASRSKGDEWMYELQRTEEFEKDVSAWMSSLRDAVHPAVDAVRPAMGAFGPGSSTSWAACRHADDYHHYYHESLRQLLQRPSVERYVNAILAPKSGSYALRNSARADPGEFLHGRVERLSCVPPCA